MEIKIKRLKIINTPKVIRMYNNCSIKERVAGHFVLKNNLILFLSILFRKLTFFLAWDNKEIIGFVFIAYFKANNLVILVKEEYQNKGIGKRLMEIVLKNRECGSEKLSLAVYKDNKPTIKFYNGFGFKVVNEILGMEK